MNPVLIGNSFPLTLVRRDVEIQCLGLTELQAAVQGADIYSYWGHLNTLACANAFSGVNLTPSEQRAALALNDDGLLTYGGQIFMECWVLSPDYVENFRPAIGQEVQADAIARWNVLKISWNKK